MYERYAAWTISFTVWKDIRFFSHGVSSLPITHPSLVMMMWGVLAYGSQCLCIWIHDYKIIINIHVPRWEKEYLALHLATGACKDIPDVNIAKSLSLKLYMGCMLINSFLTFLGRIWPERLQDPDLVIYWIRLVFLWILHSFCDAAVSKCIVM